MQSVEHITLALKVLSSNPTLGVEITWEKKKSYKEGQIYLQYYTACTEKKNPYISGPTYMVQICSRINYRLKLLATKEL